MDLTLSKRDEGQGFYYKVNEKTAPVSTAAGIFGANGSGKTALLKALDFVMSFVTDSRWQKKHETVTILPIMPWFNNEEPCRFVLEWQAQEGGIHTYTLILDRRRIVSEELVFRPHETPTRQELLLLRKGNDVLELNGVLSGANHENLRESMSFLSRVFTQETRLDSVLGPIQTIRHFSDDYNDRLNLLAMSGRTNILINWLLEINGDQFLARANDFLCRIDLGLAGIEAEKQADSLNDMGVPEFNLYGVHELTDGRRIRLSFALESEGTRILLSYYALIYTSLQKGTPLILDEFDASLHVSMLETILDLFDDPDTNPHGAQLIFSTHSETLMNRLGKAHIYLAEKRECESRIFRLDSVKGVRSSDNFSRKYLGGFYGGVPQL